MKKLLKNLGIITLLVIFSVFYLCRFDVYASIQSGDGFMRDETTTESTEEGSTGNEPGVKPTDPPVIDLPSESTEEKTTDGRTEDTTEDSGKDTTEEDKTEETTDDGVGKDESDGKTNGVTSAATGTDTSGGKQDGGEKKGLSVNFMIIGICVIVIIVLLVSRKKDKSGPVSVNNDTPPESFSHTAQPVIREAPEKMNTFAARQVRVEIFNGNSPTGSGIINMTNELIIGSSPDCDIVFSERFVAPKNTRIFESEGTIFIENIAEIGSTMVAGLPLNMAAPLVSGDVISIGEAEFCIIY